MDVKNAASLLDPTNFTWAGAIKAFLISIPKLLDEFKEIRTSINTFVVANQDRQEREIQNEQNIAGLKLQLAKSNEERAAFIARLNALEQRPR